MTAVILAGDRGENDPVAAAVGVPGKALAPVHGRPMVDHVLDALIASSRIGDIILCGPRRQALDTAPALQARIDAGDARWLEPAGSPCQSVLAALATLPDDARVLVTTADHALLKTEIVDHFLAEAESVDADVVAALARLELVETAFPGVRRTAYRFRDGAFCGCNLFTFVAAGGRRAVDFWRRVESSRKKPLLVAKTFGLWALIRYACGRLALRDALAIVSRRLELTARAVVLPFPEAAVDVDTVEDWQLVSALPGGMTT